MLGNDLFKVEANIDLSYKRNKALILFYGPLIGNDAFYIYHFLNVKGNSYDFKELNKLLTSLNCSIDFFEEAIKKLNIYRLVSTYEKREDTVTKYIFSLNNPLTIEEFSNDEILKRDFVIKVGGLYYQNICMDIKTNKHNGFKNVSYNYDIKELDSWSSDDETFLKLSKKDKYSNNYKFNLDAFFAYTKLAGFPTKYRTKEILDEICLLGDLYNISPEQMSTCVSKSWDLKTNEFSITKLKKECKKIAYEYKMVEGINYSSDPLNYLFNLQNGKEVTPVDKDIIYRLAKEYHLNNEVINVLLEYSLKTCNNALINSFIFPIANNMYHNDINTAKKAIEALNSYKGNNNKHVEKEMVYDDSDNPEFTDEMMKELIKRRNKLRSENV